MRFVAILLFFLWSGVIPSKGLAQIRLNEILADPVSDWDGDGQVGARADEWVEIMNVGSTAADLSAYRLADASGGTNWRYAFSGDLGPGEVRVVYGSDALQWQHATGYPAFGLSLNNGGDTVYLYRIAGSDTLVADQYDYPAFAVADDRSVGRRPDGFGPWVVFDALHPYNGSDPPLGTGCMPSPGFRAACETPVEGSTWGTIKSLYRG